MQQKVQFLAAIMHEPDLLILDEPFSGLDPVSARTLRELVHEEHQRGATILFSTHVMPHAEELCDHVVMIHRGRKVLDDPLSDDPAPVRSAHDPVRTARPRRGPRRRSRAAPRSRARLAGGRRLRDPARERARTRRAPSRAWPAAVPPARIEIARPRLEDIFIRIVTGGSAAADTEVLRAQLHAGAEPKAVPV